MKSKIHAFCIIAVLILATPKPARAGMIEGAVIGAAIGGVIGLIVSLFNDEPEEIPYDESDYIEESEMEGDEEATEIQ